MTDVGPLRARVATPRTAELGVGETRQQWHGLRKRLLLSLGEAVGDRVDQPADTLATVLFQRLEPTLGQLDQRAAAVRRIGVAADQTVGFQLADYLRHRLRAHPLRGRQIARGAWAFAIEPPENGPLGEREAMLGA